MDLKLHKSATVTDDRQQVRDNKTETNNSLGKII